jgi:NAD(P)-dependent dehydrogenase (short-subunit alcohol dehydrogenase family)
VTRVSGLDADIIPAPIGICCERLAGKVVLIVGASSGIGAAAARRFAEEGATVVAAARRMPLLDALVDQLTAEGLSASAVACDVRDEDSVADAIKTVLDRHGRLDGALNTAGLEGRAVPLHELAVEDFDAVQAVNARGTFLLMKHEIAAMLPTGGAIVNTSTALGLIGYSKLGDYTASKASVQSLTRTAALAYGRHRIRVNAFAPGPTLSEMFGGDADDLERIRTIARGTPLNYVALPDDMARVALFLLSDEARWITGAVLPVDGGISAGRVRWL